MSARPNLPKRRSIAWIRIVLVACISITGGVLFSRLSGAITDFSNERQKQNTGRQMIVPSDGMTLADMAKLHKCRVEDLENLNEKPATLRFKMGDRVLIPNYRIEQDEIRQGDTIGKIADRYDTAISQIVDLNPGLKPNSELVPGSFISVPKLIPGDPADWWAALARVLNSQFLGMKGITYARVMALGFTIVGIMIGFVMGSILYRNLMMVSDSLGRMSVTDKVAMIFGALVGLVFTAVASIFLFQLGDMGPLLAIICGIVFVYLGVSVSLSTKALYRPLVPDDIAATTGRPERCKILDTSVVIDGRIADICRAGFLDGTIYVPGFVLEELQLIADSPDPLKRARGRRGLDILQEMQKEFTMLVRHLDKEIQGEPDEAVDVRLVRLAQELDGVVVTNDFNLNKVASLQGVKVLNVNQLALALKPVVLPGEEMDVQIVKEGKEHNQGVGYLDDGTMVVVENGREHMGEAVTVTVTSVIGTVAGKMIFSTYKGPAGDNGQASDSDNSRGGGRRKIR